MNAFCWVCIIILLGSTTLFNDILWYFMTFNDRNIVAIMKKFERAKQFINYKTKLCSLWSGYLHRLDKKMQETAKLVTSAQHGELQRPEASSLVVHLQTTAHGWANDPYGHPQRSFQTWTVVIAPVDPGGDKGSNLTIPTFIWQISESFHKCHTKSRDLDIF